MTYALRVAALSGSKEAIIPSWQATHLTGRGESPHEPITWLMACSKAVFHWQSQAWENGDVPLRIGCASAADVVRDQLDH